MARTRKQRKTSPIKSKASSGGGRAKGSEMSARELAELLHLEDQIQQLGETWKRYVLQYDIGTESMVHCPCCLHWCSRLSQKAETDG